ncbi:MAG: TRAP transporter substrate-binding protein DctP [Thermodesulfobacteriota bacterium]|nr:TRAP transporter substrate-binding protein DctP [Thermodesulfobacteriota bacterium]
MKRIGITFIIIGLLISFIGISYAVGGKHKIVLKTGTLAPDGVGWAIFFKDSFLPTIEKVTNDEVTFDIYFGGIMGDDEDYIAKMRIDQLQAGGVSAAGIVMACPELAVFELPFLFNDFNEVNYLRTKMKKRLDSIFEKNGFKLFILIDQDFDIPWSTNREIKTPEDFAKSRFVTWCPPVEDDLLQSLGVSPIPVNVPEIPSHMRSKICNAFLAPPIYLVGTQLYTIIKYVTPCKMRYSPGGIIVTMKVWNKISKESQKAIFEVLPELGREINDFGHKSNKDCYRAMIKYGLKEVTLTSGEIEVLKKRTRPVWDKLVGKEYSRELLDEVLAFLDEYRSREALK